MKLTTIDANGNFLLTAKEVTHNDSITIYAPPSMGTATVSIGHKDPSGVVTPYTDGALIAGDQKRVECGNGVSIYAIVTGFSTTFNIGSAE